MDAGKRLINDIFNGNRILEIPFFQRAYVWNEAQWERMVEDFEHVTAKPAPYFLGSVIMKQQDSPSQSVAGDVRSLIDGQQRLTTLNILFKVLSLKLAKPQIFDRAFRVNDGETLAISHNHNDIEAFRNILQRTEAEKLEGEDNITAAYNYFLDNVDPEKIDYQTVLNNILFVGIDLSSNEDEQQIFDTINSLGIRLTTAELLKNYFFNREQLDQYEEYWKGIFEATPEIKSYWDTEITTGRLKRTLIDLFFYAFLQIKIQDPDLDIKTEEKLEFSRVENLFESYKSYVSRHGINKLKLLEEIKKYAVIFKNNFEPDITQRELSSDVGIDRINAMIFGLDNSTLIPYVLFLLNNQNSPVEQNLVFKKLESFVMRRIVTKQTSQNYNRLFTDSFISNQILTSKALEEYIERKSDKIDRLPSDFELLTGFNTSKLVNKQSAGVLYFLESAIRNKAKQSTQLLGLSKYSLEHLMPKKWENNWDKPSGETAIEERNRSLFTLGNLAIITQSLNASIRDSDWAKKKRGGPKNEGLQKYAAGIETLEQYLDVDIWDESQIENRAKDLFEYAIEIW